MPKVVILLADGFEELEAVAIADVLRRAEIEVVLAGLHDGPVASSRKIRVLPDTVIDTVKAEAFDMIVLPGGQPGADNLNADPRVRELIRQFYGNGKLTGAICAAPYVLANAGVLDGRHATSFPAYKGKLGTAVYEEKSVVEDGNVLTSRGPGTAVAFGLSIVARLSGKEKAEKIREAMLVKSECL